ncbi:sigma factor-like helix-turn-helix DNA-binding protein [Streptomyces sp. NPDC096323]|uniref:sigma factor-like helix-turn-helix DNA-binding protein n=1 Tax=Streptomyces sp. NPDC096323 TaxID=3155822 RepID=UPI00332814E3
MRTSVPLAYLCLEYPRTAMSHDTAHRPALPVPPSEKREGTPDGVGGLTENPFEPASHRPPFRSATTPEDAFDGLYLHAAPGLVHQIRLLTGDRGFAFEAVEYAFHRAWDHWPEVACDADPVGWVRAQAYEYALSPWHRLRPAARRSEPAPDDPLLGALLALPAAHRRIALLCDGLGLSIAQAAAETEASPPAAESRLLQARSALAQRVPGLDDTGSDAMPSTLTRLVADGASATLPSALSTRAGSERRMRLLTLAVYALAATLVTAIALATVTG